MSEACLLWDINAPYESLSHPQSITICRRPIYSLPIMSPLRNVLLGLSSISSIVLASPIKENPLGQAASNLLCDLENPILQAFDARASATAFCSSYLSIPVLTFSATVTATTYVFPTPTTDITTLISLV